MISFPFEIIREVLEYKDKPIIPTELNLFLLISNVYYRENFHSDIITALLSKEKNKNDGKLLMKLFIDCINLCIDEQDKECNKINVENLLTDYNVEKEKDRIDILITSKKADTAIIIENKINNAPDQDNQIPRYFKILKDRKGKKKLNRIYSIYLPLTKYKHPDESTWGNFKELSSIENKELLEEIGKSFIHLPVLNIKKEEPSLIKNWIELAISSEDIKSRNTHFILTQYKEILIMNGNKELNLGASGDLLKIILNENSEEISFEKMKNLVIAYQQIPEFIAKETQEFKLLDDYYTKLSIWESDKRNRVWVRKLEHPKPEYEKIPNVIRLSFKENLFTLHLWPNKSGIGNEEDLNKISTFLGDKLNSRFDKVISESRTELKIEYSPKDFKKMKVLIEKEIIKRFELTKSQKPT